MRELTVDLFGTADGWLRGAKSAAYFGLDGPDLQAWIEAQLDEPYVTVMGANTYRALAHFAAQGEDPASKRMDDLPKVVFSKSLRPPLTWPHTTVVSEDLATAMPAMKQQPGGPLRVIGSLSLTRSLFRLGQVDRLRLMLFPQVLGESGQERMLEGLPDLDLTLVSTKVLDERLVLVEYTL